MLDRGDYTAVVKSMGCSDPDWTRYLSGQFNRKHLCIPSLRIDRRFHYACYQTEGLQSRRVRQALSNNPHEASGSKVGGRRVGGCQHGRARHDRRDAPWDQRAQATGRWRGRQSREGQEDQSWRRNQTRRSWRRRTWQTHRERQTIREREGQAEREAGGCKIARSKMVAGHGTVPDPKEKDGEESSVGPSSQSSGEGYSPSSRVAETCVTH